MVSIGAANPYSVVFENTSSFWKRFQNEESIKLSVSCKKIYVLYNHREKQL